MFTRLFRYDKTRPEDELYTMLRKEFDHIYANMGKGTSVSYGSGGGGEQVITTNKPNTYNIHISSLVQHYHTSDSSTSVPQKGGYWTYITKEVVSTIDEIKTPVFFRDILGVKVSATMTLGNNDKYIFAGKMGLATSVPSGTSAVWENAIIKHAITYANYNEGGSVIPWTFMYKMEFCNIVENVETVVFTRIYTLPVADIGTDLQKAIERLYDNSDPAQPMYNLFTMLELIINVEI
jgi:hypothetical protein